MTSEFRLVPAAPTDEMIVAFAEAWYSKRQAIDDPDMLDAYRDMLAVAPHPPALRRELKLSGEYHADVDMLLAEIEQAKGLLKAYMNAEAEKGIELVSIRAERDTLKAQLEKSSELLRMAYNTANPMLPYRIRLKIEEHFGAMTLTQAAPAAKDGAQ